MSRGLGDVYKRQLEAAAAVGNVVLVLRSGWSRRAETRQLVELLNKRHINILGTLVIDVPGHYLEQKQSAGRQRNAGGKKTEERHHANPEALPNA